MIIARSTYFNIAEMLLMVVNISRAAENNIWNWQWFSDPLKENFACKVLAFKGKFISETQI